jgi:hypothetical protein
MAFNSRLGRFGDVAVSLTGMADFDQRAANIIANNGAITGARPNLIQTLAQKGFWDPASHTWQTWVAAFGARRNAYMGSLGGVLQQNCPRSPPGFPVGFCLHELAAPLKHGNLRWFSNRVGTIADNLQTRPDGTTGVDPASKPVWNFIINAAGEIVTGPEDFEAIKHTCLAAGADVWSAGQLGIKSGRIFLVDLQSGHYVRPNVAKGTTLANDLISFTEDIFKNYCSHFGLGCLDNNFSCIWG